MKHVAVIPMAGKGLRFVRDGFKTPKPLIQIDNEYMFVKVCKSIPKPDKWIFIYDKDIDVKYNLEHWVTECSVIKFKLIFILFI